MNHRASLRASALLGLIGVCLVSTQVLAKDDLKRVAEEDNLQKMTGVVEAVNAENRIVTIRSLGRDEVMVMEVGDEVRNLDQVKVGDRVVTEFQEAIAVDLKKGGGMEPGAGVEASASRAEPGMKPSGSMSETVTLIATIVGIDPDEPSVTLQGPEGNVVEVLVQDPKKLKKVDLGDQVVISFKRALAISVQPSPVLTPEKK